MSPKQHCNFRRGPIAVGEPRPASTRDLAMSYILSMSTAIDLVAHLAARSALRLAAITAVAKARSWCSKGILTEQRAAVRP